MATGRVPIGGVSEQRCNSSPYLLPPPLRCCFRRTVYPKREPQVGLKAIYAIAKIKNSEEHSVLLPLESVCRSVRATALSMGLAIVDDREALKKKRNDS